MSDAAPRRTYSQEEVNEILKRALQQQRLRNQVLSHDELVEMANEVGIDRDALDAATTDLAQTRANELARTDEERELALERGRRLMRFASSLFTFLVVGVALYFASTRTGGNWHVWAFLAFAIVLALQFRGVLFPEDALEKRKRRAEKQRRRSERRAARDAWRHRIEQSVYAAPSALHQGRSEFEAAVQAGVAALLTAAARKIQTQADRSNEGGVRSQAGPKAAPSNIYGGSRRR